MRCPRCPEVAIASAVLALCASSAAQAKESPAYQYSVAGSATLKTLVKGTLPVSGDIAADIALSTGAITADLTLAPTAGKLVALGFLPVQARVEFVSTAPTTGSLVGGVLRTSSKVRIKLPSVTLFGIKLAGGATCQTKSPSNIALQSGPGFAPLDGGKLSGTFAISDLTGCGGLTGLVSPLTAGKGNAIAVALTPKPSVPPTTAPPTTAPPTSTGQQLSLTGGCRYPLVGSQPGRFDISAAIPSTAPIDAALPEWAFNVAETLSGGTVDALRLIDAAKVEGTATLAVTVGIPGGIKLPVDVPLTIDVAAIPEGSGTSLVLRASGPGPSFTFPTPGVATFTVEHLSYVITLRDAAGLPIRIDVPAVEGGPDPTKLQVDCTFDPGLDLTLASISLLSVAPPVTSPTTYPTTPIATTPSTTRYVHVGHS